MEPIAVSMRQAHCCKGGFRVIGIHKNDGNFKPFGQVTCKESRPAIFRLCRKAKLVVRDDMDCPSYPVAAQVFQIQGLSNDALTWESRISMDENRRCMIDAHFGSARDIACLL